ncbi:hypothetical protein Tco_0228322 [Tanacetum coccineum]
MRMFDTSDSPEALSCELNQLSQCFVRFLTEGKKSLIQLSALRASYVNNRSLNAPTFTFSRRSGLESRCEKSATGVKGLRGRASEKTGKVRKKDYLNADSPVGAVEGRCSAEFELVEMVREVLGADLSSLRGQSYEEYRNGGSGSSHHCDKLVSAKREKCYISAPCLTTTLADLMLTKRGKLQ